MTAVTYYVGRPRHKAALRRLAETVGAIGPHGAPGVSELVGRIADAADYDLEQTAAVFESLQRAIVSAALVVDADDAAGGAGRSVNIYLGAAEAERRRAALARLAERLDTSISSVLWWTAVVAEADPERAAALVGEVMNLAAQSYVLAAEAMQQDAARRVTTGRYLSARAAMRAAAPNTSAFVVQYPDGSFDWFPHGEAAGHGTTVAGEHQVIARRAAGRGWKYISR